MDLPELGVAIHGRSFPNRAVPEDLVPSYPAPVPGRFNIGLLHTSLTGREGHDPYAPTSVDALADKGYDYFALGHVHAREVVQESAPRIVFPGNLQGRHARETGPKGCELVTVEGATLVSAEFLALDVVRWHQLHLDASAFDGLDALARCFRTQAAALAEGARDRLHALRVLLHGESPLHRIEAGQPGTLAAAIQAAALDLDDAEVWIEEVRLDLRSPMDRAAVAARTDAVGEVVRLVDALASDEAQLAVWFRARLSELGTLPGAMAGADPAQLDAAAIRALLADAEATVLARLSDTQPGGGA